MDDLNIEEVTPHKHYAGYREDRADTGQCPEAGRAVGVPPASEAR